MENCSEFSACAESPVNVSRTAARLQLFKFFLKGIKATDFTILYHFAHLKYELNINFFHELFIQVCSFLKDASLHISEVGKNERIGYCSMQASN